MGRASEIGMLPFQTVLVDSWYATNKLMLYDLKN